jgi:outer membrane protein TolC
VARAVAASRATRVAGARADERRALARGARSSYLPQLAVSGQYLGRTGGQRLGIPRGALGGDAAGLPVPFGDRTLSTPGGDAYYGFVTVAQPVTQLVAVRAGARAAAAAARAGEAEQEAARLDVALGAERLYLAALVADRQQAAARAQLAARELGAADARRATAAGFALDAARREGVAGVLEARHALVAAENDAEDARTRLAELLALPDGARLELAEPAPLPRLTPAPTRSRRRPARVGARAGGGARSRPATRPTRPDAAPSPRAALADSLPALVAAAVRTHPEARAARATAEQAARGVDAARAAYLPELSVFAQYSRQTLLDFAARNLVTGGVRLSWTGWDFGRRGADVEAAAARRQAAAENALRVEAQVATAARTAYRAAVRAERLEDAAAAALDARRDAARVSAAQAAAGLSLASARAQAEAAAAQAEAAHFAATAGARLARAELRRALGGAAAGP